MNQKRLYYLFTCVEHRNGVWLPIQPNDDWDYLFSQGFITVTQEPFKAHATPKAHEYLSNILKELT